MGSPNLFLVGSARCGTTTISEFLKSSRDVFVPAIKEPKTLAWSSHSLTLNGVGDRRSYQGKPATFTSYMDMYENVDAKYCLDASTSYLYYFGEAIPNIEKVCTNPKVIIILRYTII